MSGVLLRDETVSASTLVRASPADVFAVVSDVTRAPQWSPETRRCAWTDENRFESWNRRGLGRWRTRARVSAADPDHRFAFVVEVPRLGGDWTEWSFDLTPGDCPHTTWLTEEMRMCVDLPRSVVLFERLALGVRDRRADLRVNLEQSVARIAALAEDATSWTWPASSAGEKMPQPD